MNLDKEIPEWIMEAAEKYVGLYQSKHEKGMAESVARFFVEAFRGTGLVGAVNYTISELIEFHDCKDYTLQTREGLFGCECGFADVVDILNKSLIRATKVRK